jgi:hypothetical protein
MDILSMPLKIRAVADAMIREPPLPDFLILAKLLPERVRIPALMRHEWNSCPSRKNSLRSFCFGKSEAPQRLKPVLITTHMARLESRALPKGPRFGQELRSSRFLGGVVAGFAAGFAIVEAVFAEADGVLSHADVAIAVAFAALFHHFTGGAAESGLGRVHDKNSSAPRGRRKVPLVT